ncbi:HNH endonuclease [Rhizobium ruizarguesonis]
MTVRDIEHFTLWLTDHGAEVLEPTSEWEALRVRTNTGTHIVHTSKQGDQKWPPALLDIVGIYNRNESVALAATRRKRKNSKLRQQYGALVQRDGSECFFCGEVVAPPGTPVPPEYEVTAEHLVCVTHGGPDHLANKFLAHHLCNQKAGHLSAPEKIRLRDRMREERAA